MVDGSAADGMHDDGGRHEVQMKKGLNGEGQEGPLTEGATRP